MKNWLCLIIVALFASCSVQTDISTKAFDIEIVKKYIDSCNIYYANRFIQKDSSWFLENYLKNACVLPPNQTSICGVNNIFNFFYGNGENKSVTMLIKATNIYGNEETIVEEGTYDFPDGKGQSFDKGKFIAIWKPENGKWKLNKEIWNSDLSIKK